MTESDSAWYYATPHGDRMGPVPFRVICGLVQSGRIQPQSLVWSAHLSEWMPAERVPDLASYSFASNYAMPAADPWSYGQDTIDTLKNLEFASAILWSLVAGAQILFALFDPGWGCVLFVAAIWNIFAAVSRFGMVKKIQQRRRSVPDSYRSISPLIVIAIMNILFGACMGALLVILDFIIRDKVLKNRNLFDQ